MLQNSSVLNAVSVLTLSTLGLNACLTHTEPGEKRFHDTVVISGLDTPGALEFSKDGRIFVAEKKGLIKLYQDFPCPTSSGPGVSIRLQVCSMRLTSAIAAGSGKYIVKKSDAVLRSELQRLGDQIIRARS